MQGHDTTRGGRAPGTASPRREERREGRDAVAWNLCLQLPLPLTCSSSAAAASAAAAVFSVVLGCLSCVVLAACVLLCVVCCSQCALLPVHARSDGQLPSCDLSPVRVGQASWPNGLFGKNFTSGASSGIMPSVDWTRHSRCHNTRTPLAHQWMPNGDDVDAAAADRPRHDMQRKPGHADGEPSSRRAAAEQPSSSRRAAVCSRVQPRAAACSGPCTPSDAFCCSALCCGCSLAVVAAVAALLLAVCSWATAPVPTAFYTLRSGDSASLSADPTKYIPGGTLNEIHIRVTDFRRKSG